MSRSTKLATRKSRGRPGAKGRGGAAAKERGGAAAATAPPPLVRPELFLLDVEAATREELLAQLVDALQRCGVAQHRDALYDALLERERLGTTALGGGAALPHARSMVIAETAVAFARLRGGVDFAAPDGAPVRVVFLVVAPHGIAGTAYLPVLSAIARTIRDDEQAARLLQLDTLEELDRLLAAATKTQEVRER
jgi:mannitol/fructose-specific phosphotransferase system IIA component (Ntr-type)